MAFYSPAKKSFFRYLPEPLPTDWGDYDEVADDFVVPVPEPENLPQWMGFRRSLQLSDEFLAIANAPGNAVLAGLLFQHLQSLQSDPEYALDVALVWNQMVDNASPVAEAHVLAIAQALADHNIPIKLDLATGKIDTQGS